MRREKLSELKVVDCPACPSAAFCRACRGSGRLTEADALLVRVVLDAPFPEYTVTRFPTKDRQQLRKDINNYLRLADD